MIPFVTPSITHTPNSFLQCTSILMVTASRLVFAVARDGALPFSPWISRVSPSGRPQNAVLVMYICCALLTCTILPSAVAFSSLLAGGAALSVGSYALISFLRFFVTPNGFRATKFWLGSPRKLFYLASGLANLWLFAVCIPLSLGVSTFSTESHAGQCRAICIPRHSENVQFCESFSRYVTSLTYLPVGECYIWWSYDFSRFEFLDYIA